MKKLVRIFLLSAFPGAAAFVLVSCSPTPPVNCVLAPPGPADLGPATGLPAPPASAVVFDLKYLPQTGAPGDLQYNSYWGFGSSDTEVENNTFLQDVRKKASHRLHYVQNPVFKNRKWAAVEYHGRQATSFYFDLNADGKLSDNECILPTRVAGQGIEFITPDFIQPLDDGGQTLCRTLLQVNFYGGSQPNCMWSPAALLEGTSTFKGQNARLLLFASGPAGSFEKYGSSAYALLLGDQAKVTAGQYVGRESLSSLISSESQFYHLSLEGRRSNGLPARAVLVNDTSPTGTLALKLVATNSVQASFGSLFLNGMNDKTVFLQVSSSKGKTTLPEGTYSLVRGALSYGASAAHDWEVSFSEGPWAAIKPGEVCEVALGQPTLKVRAVDERDRYNSQPIECATFKQGTRIYFEPRIIGKNLEVYSRFRNRVAGKAERVDRTPRITITSKEGKQLLSKNMEYG
jgi:hypothetical protein